MPIFKLSCIVILNHLSTEIYNSLSFLRYTYYCDRSRIKYIKVAAKQSIEAVTEFFAETFSIDLSNLPLATSSTKSSDKKDSSTERD